MRFEIAEYEIQSKKIRGAERFTFVFLSDLHICDLGNDNAELIEAVRRIRPDAVLSGGDMVLAKGKHSTAMAERLLAALARDFPVYAANGNHELRMARQREIYGDQAEVYRRRLESAGCVVLDNRSVVLAKGESQVRIWGLDIPGQYYPKFRKTSMDPEFIRERLGTPQAGEYHILLAHSPNYPEAYAGWGADAVLAGHFHGGTIRLPLLGAVMSPDFEFFPKYAHGRFVLENGGVMMVSSGLGTHSVNLRINDPPEVVVLRIRRDEG
jgi:predicted MPP superfamily phosphohydrolase